MKSGKIGIFALTAAILFASCSIDESSYDTTINGEFDNDSNIVTTEQDESSADEEVADLFPSQIQGVYSRDTYKVNYNACDVVITDNSITVYYKGEMYEFDADDIKNFSISESNVYQYEIYDEANDIAGDVGVTLGSSTAGAYLSRISDTEQILIPSSVGYLTQTPHGIPLDSYESLDGYGEFGTIELDPRVKSFFMENAGDDFVISMAQSNPFSFATDTHQEYAVTYVLTVFDENKYITIEKRAFVFDSIDKAQSCFENIYEGYEPYYIFRIEENIIFVELLNAWDQYINTKYEYIDDSADYASFVFGQHCFSEWGVTRYYSDPISIEDGYEIVANTSILEKMHNMGGFYADQERVSVGIDGTAVNPLVKTYWHYDSTAYCFSYDIEKYEENKIHVFSKSCFGEYDNAIENVFAIGTIELIDDIFYIDIDFYLDCEGINKDNYTQYPITHSINATDQLQTWY